MVAPLGAGWPRAIRLAGWGAVNPLGGAVLVNDDRPNPSAPPVQRLRIRYAKRGPLRFTSHRDIARTFERALRRAGVPMALSQGFSPHPKISWIGAAPTGAASEAEYVEISVVRPIEPGVLAAELDQALPPGLDVLESVAAGPGGLADRIDASRWLIELPATPVDRLRAAVMALSAAGSVVVTKMTKSGRKEIDVRPAIVDIQVVDRLPKMINPAGDSTSTRPAGGSFTPLGGADVTEMASSGEKHPDPATVTTARMDDWPSGVGPYGILIAVVRQTTPAVRPDDVLSALNVVADLDSPVAAKATRIAQGRLDGAGDLIDPLAADREPPASRHGSP